MASQDGWSNERRDYQGLYENSGRRWRRSLEGPEDHAERNDEGQSGSYSRSDRQDDYRYGGGRTDYGSDRAQGNGSRDYQLADRGGYDDRDRFGLTDGFGGYGQAVAGSSYYGQTGYGQRGSYRTDQRYGGGEGPTGGFAQGYGGRYGTGPDFRRAQQPRSFWDRSSDEVASWFGDDEAARRRQHDQVAAGDHRGRGPKDYTRSDDRIREDVNDRLTDDPHIDATTISTSVKDGEVTLSGTVNDRHDKRHAEDIADSVSGVKHVQNNVRVHDTNYDAKASQAGSATRSPATSAASDAPLTRTN